MDLTNKQIRVTRMSVMSLPVQTIADVDVLEEKVPGIRTIVASFELTFEETYSGPTDPKLLLDIQTKLATV